MFTVLKYQPKINEAYIYLLMRLDNQFICWETGTEEVFFLKGWNKTIDLPCPFSEYAGGGSCDIVKPCCILFSLRKTTITFSFLFTFDRSCMANYLGHNNSILYCIWYFAISLKKNFKEKKIKVKITLNTQIPYSY